MSLKQEAFGWLLAVGGAYLGGRLFGGLSDGEAALLVGAVVLVYMAGIVHGDNNP